MSWLTSFVKPSLHSPREKSEGSEPRNCLTGVDPKLIKNMAPSGCVNDRWIHNAPINSKVQHPPRVTPGHLNFWRFACSNSLPSGQKSRSNAPPISTELPLLKDKFRLQSNTLRTFQREICRNDTFKLLLRPFWKSNLLTKAKFYLVNPSNPAKTEKLTSVLRQNKR